MPLPLPNLDDRRFQDLVDEAKRMIPRYCPEWTDHNVSDPGVTLIELFAWMVDMMIFRLNRVPDKSYITFMDLMGVRLQPAAPARAELTFWLSAPPTDPVTVPAGTQVATVQTSMEEAVNFTTDGSLTVFPPKLSSFLTSPNERVFDDQFWKLEVVTETFMIFSPRPRPGDAFYLGFAQDLSNNILALTIDSRIEGIGVDPTNPPVLWEAWCVDGWIEVEVARDETGGFNKRGQVMLYVPDGMAAREINGTKGFWVRCQYVAPAPQQPPYLVSPTFNTLSAATLGGMVSATHCLSIFDEVVGRSDGTPGQLFHAANTPILPRSGAEHVQVQREDGSWDSWKEVEHLGQSGPDDKHYMIDDATGEVAFGPIIREPDGIERQYGAVPARGSQVRFNTYRSGGGARGNVGANTITVLKNAVPYVDRVTNRRPATGGRDGESLERAKFRAPQMLRTSFRAVTAEDYEYLASEASQSVARAFCVQPGPIGEDGAQPEDDPPPGVVQLLLVPAVSYPEGRLDSDQLRLAPKLIQEVRRYLDERRPIGTVVQISEPEYVWVSVEARLRARIDADNEIVDREATARLYRFLNPLVGGAQAGGWVFGRDLYASEVFAILQGTPGVEYIENVTLNLMVDGKPSPQTMISVPRKGLVASAEHNIVVV